MKVHFNILFTAISVLFKLTIVHCKFIWIRYDPMIPEDTFNSIFKT